MNETFKSYEDNLKKDAEEKFKKLNDELSNFISEKEKHDLKIKSDTEYAIAYLVKNIDTLKIQMNDMISSERYGYIFNKILNVYDKADKKTIRRMLNKYGIITADDLFIKLLWIISFIVPIFLSIITWIICKHFKCAISAYLILSIIGFIFSFIITFRYTTSSQIKFYR